MQIKLLTIRQASNEIASSPDAIAQIMQEEAKVDRECLWCLHLNTRNRIIEKELISMGTLNCSVVSPREVFKKAILNSAASIILVHNHPGGSPNPSQEDIMVMKQLIKCGDILDIRVNDFIIITFDGYWSGRENYEEVFNNKIANLL